MKRYIFTGLGPNTEHDDIKLALKLLLSPWRYSSGTAIKSLESALADFLSIANVITFESGRTALTAILSQLNLTPNDEVLLQAYTCVAVPNAVLWAGAKPIYVDCDESFTMSANDLEKKISSNSKALIIQHTFGHVAEMNSLMAVARKYNLFVIEDCAHALGATYGDKQVGTIGDAGMFSFGRDKSISSVFGGAVVTSNTKLAESLKKYQAQCPVPSSFWIIQQLLHPPITALTKKLYGFLGIGKLVFALSKRLRLLSLAVYPCERQGEKPAFLKKKLANALAELALNQLKKLPRLNNQRRWAAQKYSEALINTSILLPTINSQNTYLRYTIRSEVASSIFSQAKKQGIFLGDWYQAPIAPNNVNYNQISYTKGSCPMAENFAQQSINLPTDIHISPTDILRITKLLKSIHND